MKERAPNITPEIEEKIVASIKTFSKKISWPLLIAKVKKATGQSYTEQCLRKHEKVAAAYRAKKIQLREERLSAGGQPHSVTDSQNNATEIECRDLKAQLNRYIEKFAIWVHNAARHGMTEAELNEPIELIQEL